MSALDATNGLRLSKREFLTTTASAAAAVCAWDPLSALGYSSAKAASWRLNLNGEWRVAKAGESDSIRATVPGCIHTDLLAAGRIPDPYYRENEKALQWISDCTWIYRRTFHVPRAALNHTRVLLRCDGLDTLARVEINGQLVGQADNMYRTYEYDVKSVLKPGRNTIEVTFTSPLPLMREKQAQRVLYEWAGPLEPRGRAWVRKEPCNFGWDWGPVLITCGIWRDIRLEAYNEARLEDVSILQDHARNGTVKLDIGVRAQLFRRQPLMAEVSVNYRGTAEGAVRIELPEGTGHGEVVVTQPKLWWPAGLGEAALYHITVRLLDANGGLLDETTRRIGLRTLRLLEKDEQNSLRFEANGITFFAKGANWIPTDAFANRVTPAILRRYVADAAAVNMNMLRFWGGGYYEEDALFDACDETGICVWLDFKFGCSSYPSFDDAFMESVRLEARDNLRRLRHHPCIAVWCGNNEISLMVKEKWSDSSMGQADYDKLFKQLLGDQVKELAPQANYVSGSPECGDIHYWEVWHGGKPFEAYRSLTGFPSEFGFQSFPVPATVYSYTAESDRTSVVTPVMQWHQRSPNGNEKIRDMTTRYFNAPKDFEMALWLSQILQGYGIKLAAEYWRQNMPRSMGCIFWQYNDCWPVASWSSVDYYGRWKALHYLARRFYAPLLVSGFEDAKKNTIDIHVTSDRLQDCRGILTWQVTDIHGATLLTDTLHLDIGARKSEKVKTLELNSQMTATGAKGLLVWLKLSVDGRQVSENLVTLVWPKELELQNPRLEPKIQKAHGEFLVTVHSAKPALWVWLNLEGDANARYSDNFFHLGPDATRTIRVSSGRHQSEHEFRKALQIRSLFDTYGAA